jgi:hypothetical protein
MATYKVIQDIEAEDKLIGPLTLRQFIYAGIAAVMIFLSYFVATHGLAVMAGLFLPVAFVAGFFAFPWGRDQPTEVWALAKIRYMLKPRRRTWDQSGIKELVTITAPKKLETNYTNNLTQEQVHSRLEALATTIDTRGWAIKNAGYNPVVDESSDRLIHPATLPQPVDDSGVQASDDILDEQNNAGAARMQNMIDQTSKERRQKIVENLKQDSPKAPKPADYWFLNQPGPAANIPKNMVTFNTQVVTPGTSDDGGPAVAADEANIVAELDARKEHSTGAYYGHMHTIQPLSKQTPATPPTPAPAAAATAAAQAQPQVPPAPMPGGPSATPTQSANAPVTPPGTAAILQLANNNDLNVATIAREAERSAPQNEVVIKLH